MRIIGLLKILATLCLIVWQSAAAAEAWSVDDCIIYAISHNYSLKNKRLDTGIARAEVMAAYGDLLPTINASGKSGRRFGHSVNPGSNQFTSESFCESTVGLNISLPLFEGLTRINRVKFAKLNQTIGSLAEKAAENSLALEIIDAYYRHCFDIEVHKLAMEQSRMGKLYYDKMIEYVNQGLRPRGDIPEFSARLQADVYQERVKANNCIFSLSALKELMTLDDTDSLTVIMPADATNGFHEPAIALSGLYKSATNCLPEFNAMELQERKRRVAYAIATGALYPSVKMEFNLNTGYYTTNSHTSVRNQLHNNLNCYVGVSVALPIFHGLSRYSTIQNEKRRLLQAEHDNEQQRLQIRREIFTTYLQAKNAVEEWKLANAQLEAASAAWSKSQEKWSEGMISGLELMESRNLYLQARVEIARTSLQCAQQHKILHFYQTGSFLL